MKHKKKLVMGLIVIPLLALTGFVTYQGWRIASPSRRALQDYHRDWLDTASDHGITITKTVCLDGRIPVLVVEPHLPLGKRGSSVRAQILERGVPLPLLEETSINQESHTVVLLHGRNGRKEDLLAVAERFCAVGLRCLLIDLPAHGENTVNTVKFGASKWEQDIPYEVLLECAEQYGFSPRRASLWGMSMGGSFVNSALADPEHGGHWKSAVVVCSFDKLDEVIRGKCKSDLLAELVSKVTESFGGAHLRHVCPAEWVKDVTTPVMVVHGDDDELITLERGKALYESYQSPEKRWVEVEGGTHQNVLVTPMPLYAEMLEWILTY